MFEIDSQNKPEPRLVVAARKQKNVQSSVKTHLIATIPPTVWDRFAGYQSLTLFFAVLKINLEQ